MNRGVIILCLIVQVTSLSAQTEKIDRLRLQEAAAAKPEEKLSASLLLLEEHESLFKDSLLPVAQRALTLAKLLHDRAATGYATLGIINARLRQDNARLADSIIRESLPKYPLSDIKLAEVHLRLCLAHIGLLAARADYEGAVNELLTVVRDAEKGSNYAILSRAFNELGVISYNRNELPQALDYYTKALSYNDRNPQAEQARAYAYVNMAMVYAWREHYDTALNYLTMAKPICERLQNLYYLANAEVVTANVYKWSGRMQESEAAMLRMAALREKTEGNLTFSNEQLGLANFYVYAKDFPKAIATYKAGLAYHAERRAAGVPPNYELLLHYYDGLSKAYHSTGARDDYENAMQRIIALKDSLAAKSSAEAITEMQTKYEVQKKETTIIAQKLDITRKNVQLYGSLLFAVLVAVIGWLLFRNYQRKSRLRLAEEKRHATQAVREAEEAERKRIAADLHDSLGSYAASIKSNADEMKRSQPQPMPALELLQTNAQQMVSLLSDTIWAMRKESLKLSDISDRIKVVLQRLRPNYADISLCVEEDFDSDAALPPVHAYHLFMIIQEAVNNALRHSGGDRVAVSFRGGGDWKVKIWDNGNGNGFAKKTGSNDGGNGLHNMRTRAESMNCNIAWQHPPAGGTKVILSPTLN